MIETVDISTEAPTPERPATAAQGDFLVDAARRGRIAMRRSQGTTFHAATAQDAAAAVAQAEPQSAAMAAFRDSVQARRLLFSGIRIALPMADMSAAHDPEARDILFEQIQQLGTLGIAMQEIALPDMQDHNGTEPLRRTVDDIFMQADLIATPVTPPNADLFRITGNPAIALPVGETDDGTSVGLQLVAARGQDLFLADIAVRVADMLRVWPA